MSLDYRKLQNGSDIRGVALEGIEGEPKNLGKEETFRLTRAFIMWLSDKTRKEPEELTISVGTDSRITANSLKEAVVDTLVHIGVKVFDAGMASTPAMFMSTLFEEYMCDGAIMITASHNPSNHNGFKISFNKNNTDAGSTDIAPAEVYVEKGVGIYTTVDCTTAWSGPITKPTRRIRGTHQQRRARIYF